LNPIAILAQTSAPTTSGGSTAPPFAQLLQSPMFIILLGLMVMMLFMSKGKKTEEKKRQNMLSQMKKGDEVQTIGGVIGKIVEVRDDRIQVKVDETANTKVWFTRNAIHRVLEADKVETK
jgi:preprotein translocase subunit YajC